MGAGVQVIHGEQQQVLLGTAVTPVKHRSAL
jgi:hypothetical protein